MPPEPEQVEIWFDELRQMLLEPVLAPRLPTVIMPLVASVVTPETAPALDTSKFVESMTSGALPPPKVIVPVELLVLILVLLFEALFRLTAAPLTVSPPVP